VDVDPLLAELLGHALLAGHGVLVEPDPLPPHRDGLLHVLGGDVLAQPDPAPLPLTGNGTVNRVVVEAVVPPQLPLLGLRQVLVDVDPGGVPDQLLLVGTRTSLSLWKAWARGTKLDLVPNRPVFTRAHAGCPVRSSR
jgi:hypothetical protein